MLAGDFKTGVDGVISDQPTSNKKILCWHRGGRMVWQAVRRIRSDQGHAEMGRSDRRRLPRTADHPRAPEKTRHTGRRRDQLPVCDGQGFTGVV